MIVVSSECRTAWLAADELDVRLVVVLGAADLEALEVAAETLTLGDPAYVGSLAGVQLGLPVVHILEEDVKEQVDPGVYEQQVGLLEMTLDVDQDSLHQLVTRLRDLGIELLELRLTTESGLLHDRVAP